MDQNGTRGPSENGIDWDLEYELSARGYSFQDTEDFLDLNDHANNLQDEVFNEAFSNITFHEDEEEDYLLQNIPNIPVHPPLVPVVSAPVVPKKSEPKISSSSSSIKFKPPKTSVSSTSKDVLTEDARGVKLTAGIAAFDRQVQSDLAKGRDPKLHKVPTFKKKEPVLTLDEQRKLVAEQLNFSPEPTEGPDVINIAIKLPSSKVVRRKFLKTDSLSLLKSFLWSMAKEEVPNKFEIGSHYPKRILCLDPTADNPIVPSFFEAGVNTNEMLYVTPGIGSCSSST